MINDLVKKSDYSIGNKLMEKLMIYKIKMLNAICKNDICC